MSNVIAVVNHKGGSGKTTTAINLAAGLTRYSDVTSSCLLIDMDPHGCATSTLLGKLDGEPPARSIFDVLRRAITPHDGITATVYDENIDILPANPSLESMAKTQITDRLTKVVASLATSYGWIIIDTPPNLGVLTQNALVAADYALIPSQCNGLAVSSLKQMRALIEKVQERQNVWLQILGVLITQKDGRTPLQKPVRRELEGERARLDGPPQGQETPGHDRDVAILANDRSQTFAACGRAQLAGRFGGARRVRARCRCVGVEGRVYGRVHSRIQGRRQSRVAPL